MSKFVEWVTRLRDLRKAVGKGITFHGLLCILSSRPLRRSIILPIFQLGKLMFREAG